MKKTDMIIFFSIVLLIYFLVNFYIFIRGWQAIPSGSSLKMVYIPLFIILSLSFIAGRILERVWLSRVSDVVVWTGSFWMGAMLYFFLIIVFLDLLRFAESNLHFFPAFATFNYEKTKIYTAIISIAAVAVILTAGYFNSLNPKIKTLDLKIVKQTDRLEGLNIVVVSDIHLGTTITKSRLERIVSEINSLNPDVVLLAGDVLDEDIAPVIRHNTGETLREIKSRYGVYAVTGNHEYIGGVTASVDYLKEHNVIMLRDSAVKIANSVYLVGREDRDKERFSGIPRKPLKELMKDVDNSYPVIVMNHQPTEFDSAVENNVDLHLSGHTHNGQMWPFNYLTSAIYEVSRGFVMKGNTNFYVSTGAGTWGPPVRIGNRPEIVNIKLKFESQ